MTTYLADANVFLRFVLNDNPSLHKKAEVYFHAVKNGTIRLIFLREVIVEIVFVLQKVYKIPRGDIVKCLSSLINMPSVEIDTADEVLQALRLYTEQNISYVDSLILATADSRDVSIATFDKKVGKLSS